ncbi:MAG: hypothetical protein HY538_00125 [Deltaproteobacteria bacterium]|nr:hypothetical protein [Deltaproteobacteria bacterium]
MKITKRRYKIGFFIFWSCLANVFAEPLPVPQMVSEKEIYQFKIELKEKGNERGAQADMYRGIGETIIQKSIGHGSPSIVITEKVKYLNGIKIFTESTYGAKEKLIPIHQKRTMWGIEGKQILFQDLSGLDFRAIYPSDTYLPGYSGFELRGVLQNSDQKISFHAASSFFIVNQMHLEVDGVERVKIPAGEWECYRVKMSPDARDIVQGSVTSFVANRFIPSYYFWFTRESPHRFIKFEGSIGPSIPEMIIEVISLKVE